MKRCHRMMKKGMTLVELTLAMGVGLSIAAIILLLMNQQITFLRILGAQSFLSEEAPMIGLYVGKMAGKADRFRLHATIDDALAGRNPRLTASPVMLMNFRQPDGTMRSAILAYEEKDGREELNYYLVPDSASPSLGTRQWSITRKASDVSFFVTDGILRMQLTGPADERLTYSGTMQQ
ncbi:hypothetical protein OVA24_09485 [Luteolibacter sp. SL250]|uniref:hypothetical protein n=1 Tax=Luteolibacter sp. SL250 TaxID=2995170 RepID=UPI00226DBE19|nr:hypothetical protein [Luteolibacter sp. SL250]WAC21615.1 hypothetical protein OVA24_09485 [Luteolibacter sp. SL250]